MHKILRRGGKNTQKNCTKKVLHDSDNHDGVITHQEPDIRNNLYQVNKKTVSKKSQSIVGTSRRKNPPQQKLMPDL